MYDYDLYDYSAGVSTTSSIGTFPLIGGSLASILIIVSLWKIFKKAGKPGWAAIIPIYREIMFTEIVGRPTWWAFIYIIPCTAFIAHIILSIDLARSFGQPTGFSVGLILFPFIFYPILGFGSAQYVGPSATDKN